MTDEGTVRFSVPAVPPEAGPVVEIRDHKLRHLMQVQPGHEIELEPGLYLASVVLPTGESEQRAVAVTSGQPVEVELGPDRTELEGDPLATHEAALEADLPSDLVLGSSGPAEDQAAAPAWYVRLLRAADGAPLEAEQALRADRKASEPTGSVSDLLCEAPPGAGGDAMWLQVAVHGQVPSNCLLPILPGTAARTSRVRVIATADAVRATALPTGNRLTDSVASYLATGHVRAAAHIAANARKLLFAKIENPVGAALGAYALLRLGRLDEVGDWVTNLAEWVPSLPDGAVIAAEQAARSGRGEESEHWLAEAVQRGTPMFADGLSLLVARLRPKDEGDTVSERGHRLLDMATLADFAQLVVAFRAADPLRPADSQSAIEGFDPADGWQQFRHGEAVAVERAGA